MRRAQVKNLQYAALGVAGALSCTTAMAQQASRTGPVLEEIVVSAQRTQESLQDVPISVTALGEDDLERRQVTNTLDMISQVPNLVGSNNVGLGSATSFFLRGVGQDESISTSDPAVGTYIDGVYIARQINNNSYLYDVERIEVLRGPQGTLYGRNTSGGAVRIITVKPEDEFKGYLDLSYGDYDRYSVKGMLNAPLSDALSFRLNAFTLGQGEGFQKSLTTGKEFWAPEGVGGRVQLRYQPSDAVDATLSIDYADEEGTEVIGSDFNRNTDKDFFTVVSGLKDQFAETDQIGVTLNMEFALGDMTLASITGWRDLNQTYRLDLSDDVVPQYVLPHDSNHKQVSQEFTLSATSGKLDWLAGVFYMKEENESTIGDELFLFGGALAGNFRKTLDNDADSYAIFAQATYNLTDHFAITLGGRYTEEDKTVDVVQYVVLPGPATGGDGDFPGAKGVLVPLWDTSDIKAAGTPSDLTFTEFTPKVALEYRQSEDLLWYASYTEGFKSGGWNARVTDPLDFVAFDPETVKSYEVGLKSELFDNRLRANLTLFRADYDDFIITALNENGRFVTINAAEVQIQGVEAELMFRATDDLDLFGNLGTMDNEYKKLVGADFPITNEVKRTPKLSYQLGFNWSIPVATWGGGFFTTGTFSHQDEYYGGLKNDPVELSEATDIVDFLVGYGPDDGRWTLEASCKNCTDEEYHHSTLNFGTLGFATQFPGLPRTYQVRFRYNFGAP
jgi:iron complex outermembrane receptor protein